MIKPTLIPTPLNPISDRSPIEISQARVQLRYRGWIVARCIIGYLLGLAWRRTTGRYDAAREGRLLRERLEAMGMLWVKIGQLLSLRIDQFPDAFCDELSKLQYRAVGFPAEEALRRIDAAVGGRRDELFEWIDPAPLAAASIAQVHRARLRDGGRDVVIKVRRPQIDAAFRIDLAILRRIVGLFVRLGTQPQLRLAEGVWELERIMEEELDYRIEASNLRRFRKAMRARKAYSPRPYLDLSNADILVMEFIPGVLMSEMIETERQAPAKVRAWQIENGVDPEKFGRRLYFLLLRQIITDNLFHGDLHPGNIMILRGGRVALIDFGAAGSLNRRFVELYAANLAALARRDFGLAVRLTLKMCEPLPHLDVTEVTRRMLQVYRAWEMRSHIRDASYHERSLSSVEGEAARVLSSSGIASDWSVLRMSRTWGTLDSTLAHLMPDADYTKLLARFFRLSETAPSPGWCAPAAAPPALQTIEGLVGAIEVDYLEFEQTAGKAARVFAACCRAIAVLLGALALAMLVDRMAPLPFTVAAGRGWSRDAFILVETAAVAAALFSMRIAAICARKGLPIRRQISL